MCGSTVLCKPRNVDAKPQNQMVVTSHPSGIGARAPFMRWVTQPLVCTTPLETHAAMQPMHGLAPRAAPEMVQPRLLWWAQSQPVHCWLRSECTVH